MRHAAVTVAGIVRDLARQGQRWDVLWCSDMLNLAEFLGLAPPELRDLPCIVYFHENQLTYPVRIPHERDLHFAFSNFTTALAADAVWFNSAFHRDEFLSAMNAYLSHMPDHAPLAELEQIAAKSYRQHPGIDGFPPRSRRQAGPLRVLWNGRWEYDKNPEDFFAALRQVQSSGTAFRLLVLGESFRESPQVFEQARRQFMAEIDHWGYVSSDDYRRVLCQADVVVSTAIHEFFGIGVVEAVAAGAIPLLPNRLAYPELLETMRLSPQDYTYNGSVEHLAQRLTDFSSIVGTPMSNDQVRRLQGASEVFSWTRRATAMDNAAAGLAAAPGRLRPS